MIGLQSPLLLNVISFIRRARFRPAQGNTAAAIDARDTLARSPSRHRRNGNAR
jgi:hypothetical protein